MKRTSHYARAWCELNRRRWPREFESIPEGNKEDIIKGAFFVMDIFAGREGRKMWRREGVPRKTRR